MDRHRKHSHSRHSRSRSRSRSHERNRDHQEKRVKKPSRFDDPNPEKLPAFDAPPSQFLPPPLPSQSSRKTKWSNTTPDIGSITGPLVTSDTGEALVTIRPADNMLNLITDADKIKKKIYLPKDTTINYIGLIIGPKGMYQKKLEEQTGCKILIRGKNSMPKESQKDKEAREAAAALNPGLNIPPPDADEDQHVLIIGDKQENVDKAEAAVMTVLNADEETRNAIREAQLKAAEEVNNTLYGSIDESLLTPYGPPSPNAYIIPVPNECIGLIIGKGGETIRQLQQESGAKIQVAKKEIPNTNIRNVFVEGAPDRYEHAKRLIEAIVEEHQGALGIEHTGNEICVKYPVPNNMVGLLIGRGGENLKKLMAKTHASIHIPKTSEPGSTERAVEIRGSKEQIEAVKREIMNFTANLTKAAQSAVQSREKAPAAIALYLPSAYSSASGLPGLPGQKEEKRDPKEIEKALAEVQKQQQLQAELASYASIYQQFYANYDPLYEQYFKKELLGKPGKGANESAQKNAAQAVQEAYSNYTSYYNGYLLSGNNQPRDERPEPNTGGRRGGRY